MIGLHFLIPGGKLIPFPWTLWGAPLIIIGVIMNITGATRFGKVETTIRPYEVSSFLVTEGLFRFSRNPMYLGMLFVLIGVALFLGSLTPYLVALAFFVLINELFIKVEEKMLEERFGQGYLAYKQRVRRWM